MTSAALRRTLPALILAGVLAACSSTPAPLALDLVPHVTSRVFPAYPEAAKRSGIEGTVTVSLYVNEDGTVGRIEALSSANELLTGAVLEALRRWRFDTPVENGRRIPFTVEYTVEFTLDTTPHVAMRGRSAPESGPRRIELV
jgi:TonB family protein